MSNKANDSGSERGSRPPKTMDKPGKYRVIFTNDQGEVYQYHVDILSKVFNMNSDGAEKHALEANQQGHSVIMKDASRDVAETKAMLGNNTLESEVLKYSSHVDHAQFFIEHETP